MFSTLWMPVYLLTVALGLLRAGGPVSPPHPVFAAASARAAACAVPPPSGELAPVERALMEHINAERTGRGLSALASEPILVRVARAHSDDMSARGYFSHTAPSGTGRTPMDRYLAGLDALGLPIPRTLLVGENIYYCSAGRGARDAALVHAAFMNSPAHRANILGARFRRVGVGAYRDAQGRLWVTEMFVGS